MDETIKNAIHDIISLYNDGYKDVDWPISKEESKYRNAEELGKVLIEKKEVLFKSRSNGVAGINWGAMNNDDFVKLGDDELKKLAEKLLGVMNSLDSNNDTLLTKYKNLLGTLTKDKGFTQDYNVLIARLVITFAPDKLLAVPGHTKLSKVAEKLGITAEEPGTGKLDDAENWLIVNRNIVKWLNANCEESLGILKSGNNWNDSIKFSCLGWKLALYCGAGNDRFETEKTFVENHKNVVYSGAPGTGKTYLAKLIAAQVTGTQVETDEYKNKVGFVQFHPSYDYSDFVEGLRPVKDTNSNIGFERKDGVFKAFCKKALNEGYNKTNDGKWEYKGKEAPRFVFIIDEINRGEMSKIFGELFFSIDPGYRGTKGRIKTQYQNLVDYEIGADGQKTTEVDVFKDGFFVPENVYIIGTMNDIDRSVESMDFAMRRRFAFKEVRATDREYMLDEVLNVAKADEAKRRMYNLNYRIQEIEGLNEAYHVGPAYFTKVEEDGGFPQLWENRIKGLLCEYLRGMPNAKELIESLKRAYKCTDDYVENKNGELKLRKASSWQNNIVNKPKNSKNANIGDGEDDSSEG